MNQEKAAISPLQIEEKQNVLSDKHTPQLSLPFITPAEPFDCPTLRRRFAMPAGWTEAKLEMTGLGLYRAELNGERVGREYLTPGFNDYDAYLRVQTYDVSDQLRSFNELRVTLGKGWCMSRLGPSSGDPYHWGNQWLLAARLTVSYPNGHIEIIETDEAWEAVRSPITMSELYDGEHRDDTRPEGMPISCRRVETEYVLEEPISPPIREKTTLTPVLIHTPRGEQVLDFGQNFAGVIRFWNRLPAGKTLLVQTGEVLQEGCFYRENLDTALSEFQYTSDGQEKWVEPWFTFFGFRYARVTSDTPIDPADFVGMVLSSDLRETLEAETDHPGLNRLMQNALWSQRSNFLDVPTDCPQRDERLGWTADTQVFVPTACYQMDCKAFYRKYIKDMRVDQTRYYRGDIPMYVPSLKGEAGPGGAVWADAATLIPWQVYWNYGDVALLRESYPLMRDYTETLIAADRRLGGSHLRFDAFTFGDWLALDGQTRKSVFGGTEHAFIQGIYYFQSVQLTARAANTLGEKADAARYSEWAEAIHKALVEEYVTPGGRLALDTQTAYILALKHGILRDRDKMIAGFRERLRRDGFSLRCGFTGAPQMISVLMDNGLAEEAWRILLSEEYPGWLYEVKQGATTIWERWNSLEPDGRVSDTSMNSFNHYAYGAVCEAIYSRIMGLACAAPGWKKARIAPHLDGRVRRSRIAYDSPAGRYEVAWEILPDGQIGLKIGIPEGAEAELLLPEHPEGAIEVLSAGTYTYTYQPKRDLLRPFDEHSLILDLLRCPAGEALLRQQAPTLWAAAKDPESDVRFKRMDELSWGVPKSARAEAKEMLPLLKTISL